MARLARRRSIASRDTWQQFVIRVRDERGDAVPDFNVQLEASYESGETETLADFASDVHVWRSCWIESRGRTPGGTSLLVRLTLVTSDQRCVSASSRSR